MRTRKRIRSVDRSSSNRTPPLSRPWKDHEDEPELEREARARAGSQNFQAITYRFQGQHELHKVIPAEFFSRLQVDSLLNSVVSAWRAEKSVRHGQPRIGKTGPHDVIAPTADSQAITTTSTRGIRRRSTMGGGYRKSVQTKMPAGRGFPRVMRCCRHAQPEPPTSTTAMLTTTREETLTHTSSSLWDL